MLLINKRFSVNPISPCAVMFADVIDAQEITDVIKKSFDGVFNLNTEAYNKEIEKLIPERLADPKRFTVYKCVTDEKKIVGTATGIWHGYYEQKGVVLPEIGTVAVLPEYRGKKIADRLIGAVEEGAKERNFPGITLCHSGGFDIVRRVIDPRMESLHRFYKKLGFHTLDVGGRLQHNMTPVKPKFTTAENPGGRSFVVWMAKMFSESSDPIYFRGKGSSSLKISPQISLKDPLERT
jgi:GNAT superfamily N-acetyltransferase